VGTPDAVEESADLFFVLRHEGDMPAISIQAAVRRDESYRVSDAGRPFDGAYGGVAPVRQAAMRRGRACNTTVGGRGKALAPSLSDPRIYAQNCGLVLSHKCVFGLLFRVTSHPGG